MKFGDLIEYDPVYELLLSMSHLPSPPVVHGALGNVLFGGSNVYGFGLRVTQSVGVNEPPVVG